MAPAPAGAFPDIPGGAAGRPFSSPLGPAIVGGGRGGSELSAASVSQVSIHPDAGCTQGAPDAAPSPTADVAAVVLGSLIGSFAVASTLGLGVLGFAGGTVPLLAWELPGGAGPGLAWLAFMATVGVAVLWFVPLLLSMAAYAAVSRLLVPAVVRRGRPAPHSGRRRLHLLHRHAT